MPALLATDIHGKLLEAASDALWLQWRAVGGMTSARTAARSIVDPEALILGSLALAAHERRLDDVARDWVVSNSELLSVQRIKNLTRAFPARVAPGLEILAGWMLCEGKDARWRSLVAKDASNHAAPGRPERAVLRATAPDLRDPAAIMLRLRLGIGIGNKADVLAYLLGSAGSAATVREIAEATGYTVHALHRTVEEMARAGFVYSTGDSPAAYQVESAGWRKLLSMESLAAWRHWWEVYAYVADLDNWMHETRGRTISEYAFGVHARELMSRYREVFVRAGERMPRDTRTAPRGYDPVKHFETVNDRLEAWMSRNV